VYLGPIWPHLESGHKICVHRCSEALLLKRRVDNGCCAAHTAVVVSRPACYAATKQRSTTCS
jgi:hypothetical protein